MRLSDILKKTGKQTAQPAAPDPVVKNEAPRAAERKTTIPKPSLVCPVTPMPAKIPVLAPDEVYNKAITEAKSIIQHVEKNAEYSGRLDSVQEIIELVEDNNEDIAILADKSTPDMYLYSHGVNVCIFALILGKQVGFKDESLKELGCAAFLHDIGLVRSMSLVMKKGKLTPAEFGVVKKHSQAGFESMQLFSGMASELRSTTGETILQVHERPDGGGYPLGLKGKDIGQYAKTIAIADVYEALTHPRAYRDRFIPHEALKTMIGSAEANFDQAYLKAFIERMSLYPPGSYVRMNSEEVARVVRMNPGMPTRPVLKVIVSQKGARVPENKVVDLACTPMLFIKEAVDETRIDLADKRLALELKAIRWWVKGL